MLRLINKELSEAAKAHLSARQSDIDGRGDFSNRAHRADQLWDAKMGSKAGLQAFEEVKNTLISMCVGVEICNYCEQSEASDIEHILPKSLFPQEAFVWRNYLLACKKCNTTHKLDAIHVFNPANSAHTLLVERGTEPPSTDYAFIQPRLEDPMDWMQLNLKDFLFYAKSPHAPGTRGFQKVERTLEILALNNRRTLVNYRKHAFGHYKRLLQEYVASKQANTHQELVNAVNGDPEVDPAKPFQAEQHRVLNAIQKSILTGEHPTVWREMVRQRQHLPAPIQQLFLQAPEALTW